MPDLSAIQNRLANALFDTAAPAPDCISGARRRRATARLAIHRNNVAARLVGALAARFPATRTLVGAESFAALARLYTIEHPPRSAVLLAYGDTLPCFIRSLGPAPALEYVADVADLEASWSRAYHAADADATAVDLNVLHQRGMLGGVVCRLHPSTAVVSSRFPVVSIWESSLSDDPAAVQWKPEAALVARPHDDVQVWRLPPGGLTFVTALTQGSDILTAAATAISLEPAFSLDINLDLLTRANICTEIDRISLLAA